MKHTFAGALAAFIMFSGHTTIAGAVQQACLTRRQAKRIVASAAVFRMRPMQR